jgi:hypothetical protein
MYLVSELLLYGVRIGMNTDDFDAIIEKFTGMTIPEPPEIPVLPPFNFNTAPGDLEDFNFVPPINQLEEWMRFKLADHTINSEHTDDDKSKESLLIEMFEKIHELKGT